MVVRISLMVLRLCVVLAVILGVCFWLNILTPAGTLLQIHMLLGVLVVLTLWIIGVAALLRGSIGGGVLALIWGAVVLYVGLNQDNSLAQINPHWLIQALHLLLGLGAAGVGESVARRYKRSRKA